MVSMNYNDIKQHEHAHLENEVSDFVLGAALVNITSSGINKISEWGQTSVNPCQEQKEVISSQL